MLTSSRPLQRQARSGRLQALLCAVVLGIVGMHSLGLHGGTTGADHAAHGMVMGVPADGPSLMADDTEPEGPSYRTPADGDHGSAMTLCLMMLAGAGATLLLLLSTRRSRSWLHQARSVAGHTMAAAMLSPPPPAARRMVLRC